jgi:hypothetical protein
MNNYLDTTEMPKVFKVRCREQLNEMVYLFLANQNREK